jgi:hypothetical protein
MSYWIQVCNPVALHRVGGTAGDLSEAIEAIFPMITEDALIVWNHEYIPLNYKYDFSAIIDDLLPMCSSLLGQAHGTYKVSFGSDTFNSEWLLKWFDGKLFVTADWSSVVGSLEAVRSNCSDLETTIDHFLSEWKGVFKKIIIALEQSNIEIVDSKSYGMMREIDAAIKNSGYLYKNI